MKIAKEDGAAQELRYGGELIHRGKDGMVSLTDMWKAMGSPPSKSPSEWLRSVTSADVERVLELNMGISHVYRQRPGRYGGGSWAHPLAAIAYAKFLSPEFHVWANKVILERLSSRNRQAAKFRNMGRDSEWIRTRLEGVPVRKGLTDTLKEHGVTKPVEYAVCTDAEYKSLFGKSKKELCLALELSPKANLRDHLESPALAAIRLTESVAEQGIQDGNLHGVSKCSQAITLSATAVSKAIAHAKQEIAALGDGRHRP